MIAHAPGRWSSRDLILSGADGHEEDALLESALIRGVRRGRGVAVPGAARDPLVLVSDLARPAGGSGAGQPARGRAGSRALGGRRPAAGRGEYELAVSAHEHAVLCRRTCAWRRRSRGPTRTCRSASWARTWPCPRRPRFGPRRRSTSSRATSSTTRSWRWPRDGRSSGGWDLLQGRTARVVHNRERATLENMDALPFVTEVYKRDLVIEDYFIGYLLHPYVSLYTGRGCRSRCTFCLWPQTIGGHRYRTRSPENVIEEIRRAKEFFPQVKEFFFDDDTFTDDLPAGGGDCAGARRARRHVVVQREGDRSLRDAEDPQGQRPAPAARGLRDGQPADPEQHPQGDARGRRRGASPRTATSSASPSTARSSWGCRARRRRRSRARSASPTRSTRTRSRSRWPRRIPGTELYQQASANGWLDLDSRASSARRRRPGRVALLPAPVQEGDLSGGRKSSTSASTSDPRRSSR